jgi:L-fuculose-phosphate aldolase
VKKPAEKNKHFIRCCHDISAKGMSWGASGNFSMRRDRKNFFITASGSHFARMKPSEIICCSISEASYVGSARPSVEHTMHREVYQARPDIEYIVHVHPLFSVLMISASDVELNYDIIPEARHYLGAPAYVPYLKAGSKKLAHAVRARASKSDIIILKNHGIVALGKTFEEATSRAEAFEFVAQLNYYALVAQLKVPMLK